MSRSFKAITAFLFVLLTAALPLAAGNDAKDSKSKVNRNIRFGMPSPAMKDPKNHDEYLIERPQFVISYNDKKKTPNWVSWQLVKSDLGHAVRNPFSPDPLLPDGFTKVKSADYNGSGFDRGHMCPSHHRANSEVDNDETFVMSNIIPQAPNNNQKAWERLEAYCHDLAADGKELHIVSGPFGVGGFGKNGFALEIGHGTTKVVVPSRVWKVILILPRVGAMPTNTTRTIAVIMPNNQEVDHDWTKWRVSINDVEKLTSYTFFPDIKGEVAETIKAAPDDTMIDVQPAKFKKAKKKKKKGEK